MKIQTDTLGAIALILVGVALMAGLTIETGCLTTAQIKQLEDWVDMLPDPPVVTNAPPVEPPAPPPEPPPVVEPPPSTEPIDLSKVKWLHTNVSGWPVTSTLNVRREGGMLVLDYDKARVWPGVNHVGAFVNANPWVFAKINGQWHAATWEWFRKSQNSKPASKVAGDHVKRSPMAGNWKPTPGETYGFMVSGLARDSKRTVKERTNVVMITWR